MVRRWLSRNVVETRPDGSERKRGLSVVTILPDGLISIEPFMAESEGVEFTDCTIRVTPPSKIEFL